MNYLIQSPDNYSYDEFIKKNNTFIEKKQTNVRNNIFNKNKVSNNKIELHKKRLVKNYLIPLLYLIYSKIYLNFYKKKSVDKLLYENTLIFDMYKIVFSLQNPIIKKVNIFLHKNLLKDNDPTKNIKKEDIKIEINNTQFINFLEKVNEYIQNQDIIIKIKDGTPLSHTMDGSKMLILNKIKDNLEECYKSLYKLLYNLTYATAITFDVNLYDRIDRENQTLNIKDIINDINTKFIINKDNIIYNLIIKNSPRLDGFNMDYNDNFIKSFTAFYKIVKLMNEIRLLKIQLKNIYIDLPSIKALTVNNIYMFYKDFMRQYNIYNDIYQEYNKYKLNIEDIIKYLELQDKIYKQFESDTDNLNKEAKKNNYIQRIRTNNNMIFYKIIVILDIIQDAFKKYTIPVPIITEINEADDKIINASNEINKLNGFLVSVTNHDLFNTLKKYINICKKSIQKSEESLKIAKILNNNIDIAKKSKTVSTDVITLIEKLDKKKNDDVQNELKSINYSTNKLSEEIISNISKIDCNSYYNNIIDLIQIDINTNNIIDLIKIFLIILYKYKNNELKCITKDVSMISYDTNFASYKIKFNDIYINITKQYEIKNTNKYEIYIKKNILETNDIKLYNDNMITKPIQDTSKTGRIAPVTPVKQTTIDYKEEEKNYQGMLNRYTEYKGKIETYLHSITHSMNNDINISIIQNSCSVKTIDKNSIIKYIWSYNNITLYNLIDGIVNSKKIGHFTTLISELLRPITSTTLSITFTLDPFRLAEYKNYLRNTSITSNTAKHAIFNSILENFASFYPTENKVGNIRISDINNSIKIIFDSSDEIKKILSDIDTFTLSSSNATKFNISPYTSKRINQSDIVYNLIENYKIRINEIIPIIRSIITKCKSKNENHKKKTKKTESKILFDEILSNIITNIKNYNTEIIKYSKYIIDTKIDNSIYQISEDIKKIFNEYYPIIVRNLDFYKDIIISLISTKQNMLYYFYQNNQPHKILKEFLDNKKNKSDKNKIFSCIKADKIYFDNDLTIKIKNISDSQPELKYFFNQYENEYCKKCFSKITNLLNTNKSYIEFDNTTYLLNINEKKTIIEDILLNNTSIPFGTNKYTISPYTNLLYMYLLYLLIIIDYLDLCK